MKAAAVPGTSYTIGNHPSLAILNPALPGAHNGIRDIDPASNNALHDWAAYSRNNLLGAIETYCGSLQTNFPGKFVQIGFWSIETDNGSGDLTEFLRTSLLSYFNGTARDRVGFWEDNSGAGRGTAGFDYVPLVPSGGTYTNPLPYTLVPTTTFATPLALSKTSTWTGFQTLGSWMFALNDDQMGKDANGSPNDAFEGSYNDTYYSMYWEIYHGDALSTRYQAGLQRWHDYLATLTP